MQAADNRLDRLRHLIKDINSMLRYFPAHSDDFRALQEELKKAKQELKEYVSQQ